MEKGLFFLFICGALFFSCSDSDMSSDGDVSIVENNVLSVSDIANNLGNSFMPITRSAIENGTFDYPDYYGGMCVKDNQKLVVFVLDGDLDSFRRDLEERCQSSNFELLVCQYSMNQIISVSKKISESDSNILNELKIYYWGVDEEKNRLLVMMGDVSEGNLNRFKSLVIDSPVIEFCESTPVTLYAETVSPGSGGYEAVGPGWGSIGFRCKYQNKNAFVTSGHIMRAVGKVLYKDETYAVSYGTCVACDVTGRDIAICTPSTGITISNTFTFGSSTRTLSTKTSLPSKDLPVGLKGKYNASSGSIKITSTSFPNRTYTAFAAGDFTSANGDSGGIVFNRNDNSIVGILMAGAVATVDGVSMNLSFFTPYSAISGKYGITLY